LIDVDSAFKVATFFVGTEEYAVDIMKIRQIVKPSRVTPIPKAPSFIEGIMELRQIILPVVDLRKRFGLPAPPPGRDTKFVIVSIEGNVVGMVVDKVGEVLTIEEQYLRRAPALAIGEERRFFAGVYRRELRMVLILDIEAVLTSSEKLELSGMREATA
jgi:purine-binding chemotaxis protein CheW